MYKSYEEEMNSENRFNINDYSVLPFYEAIAIISSQESQDGHLLVGMGEIYQYIIDNTNQNILVTENNIRKLFGRSGFRITEILEFLCVGSQNKSQCLPIIYPYVYFQLFDGKHIETMTVFACSHQKNKIRDVCRKYDNISAEEIQKRSQIQKKNPFISKKEHENFLKDKIENNEFYKTYAFWFFENSIGYNKEYIDILHSNVLPLISPSVKSDYLLFRNIDRKFKSIRLRPIILFKNDSELLFRYRFLVKNFLLKKDNYKLDFISEIQEAEELFKKGTEDTERLGQIAKKKFDFIIEELNDNDPSDSDLQQLQIFLEIFAIKKTMKSLIEREVNELFINFVGIISESANFFSVNNISHSFTERVIEKGRYSSLLYFGEYPLKDKKKIDRLFLYKKNLDLLFSELAKDIQNIKLKSSERIRYNTFDEVQVQLELLLQVVPEDSRLKSLQKEFVKAKSSLFKVIFYNILYFMNIKKSSIEEEEWKEIQIQTATNIAKLKELKKTGDKEKMIQINRDKAEHSSRKKRVLVKENEKSTFNLDQIKKLSQDLTSLWFDFFHNIRLSNYIPPTKDDIADLLGINSDKVDLFIKEHISSFKKFSIIHISLRRQGVRIYLTQKILKEYGQFICDLYNTIDRYEFSSNVRNQIATKRMDFAHDFAEYLHSKGFREKNDNTIVHDYKNIINQPSSITRNLVNMAQLILKLTP